MWNTDFYWAPNKQTHIRLDPSPRAWVTGTTRLLKTPHGDLQQSSLHQCWWRTPPSSSLNIRLPVLLQECRKGDVRERVFGDGIHMTSNWRISHGNHNLSPPLTSRSRFCIYPGKILSTKTMSPQGPVSGMEKRLNCHVNQSWSCEGSRINFRSQFLNQHGREVLKKLGEKS